MAKTEICARKVGKKKDNGVEDEGIILTNLCNLIPPAHFI